MNSYKTFRRYSWEEWTWGVQFLTIYVLQQHLSTACPWNSSTTKLLRGLPISSRYSCYGVNLYFRTKQLTKHWLFDSISYVLPAYLFPPPPSMQVVTLEKQLVSQGDWTWPKCRSWLTITSLCWKQRHSCRTLIVSTTKELLKFEGHS